MTAELVAAWAGVVAAVCAAAGLVFSGLQTRQATASRDFDTLTDMLDRMRELEDRLMVAVGPARQALSVQLINWIELLIVSLDRKLIGPTSREFGRDLAIDVLAMLEQSNAIGHLGGRLTGSAYKHTAQFINVHGKAIKKRVDDMIAQDLERPRA